MRKHNGMRPQDIVVLLKIVLLGKKEWQYQDLVHSLYISGAEINASLKKYNDSNLQVSASTERQWLTEPPNVYRKPATITPEIEAQAIAAGAKTDKPWYEFW